MFSGNIHTNVELNPIANYRMDKVIISSEKDATIINKTINIINSLGTKSVIKSIEC